MTKTENKVFGESVLKLRRGLIWLRIALGFHSCSCPVNRHMASVCLDCECMS